MSACRSLADSTAGEAADTAPASIPPMMPELAKQTAERLRNAAEMGNITELKAIAEGLKSDSDQFSSTILQLAEDFDFDGILKLATELDGTASSGTVE